MNKRISIYGFSGEQLLQLMAHMPDGYVCKEYDDPIELVAEHGLCVIICAEGMDRKARGFLDNFYSEVGENIDEQVIWVDSQTKLPVLEGKHFYYNGLSELLPELDKVLARAQKHYAIQRMYCSAYAFLPKRGIEEMLEKELWDARQNKYGKEPEIYKRVRQEWTALLEIDAIVELAAVYEFVTWLKHHKHPYLLVRSAASGMVPYLLGLHDVNPLPPHSYCPTCQKVIWRDDYKDGFDLLPVVCPECGGRMQGDGHNLVWQEYASYGRVPTYVFYLPNDMKPIISDWLDSHWLRKRMEDQWEVAQPCENCLVRGNMHFRFKLDRNEISSEYYNVSIDANRKGELIQIATQSKYHHRDPYPKDMEELLMRLGFRKTVWKDGREARGILRKNNISWRNIPTCSEEVFFYLRDHGFVDKDAFRGMLSVRKGEGLPVIAEDMQTEEDHWKAEYFNLIEWLPCKATELQSLFFEAKSKAGKNDI
jgi:hypothetical protein